MGAWAPTPGRVVGRGSADSVNRSVEERAASSFVGSVMGGHSRVAATAALLKRPIMILPVLGPSDCCVSRPTFRGPSTLRARVAFFASRVKRKRNGQGWILTAARKARRPNQRLNRTRRGCRAARRDERGRRGRV